MTKQKKKAYSIFMIVAALFAILSATLISVFAVLRTNLSSTFPRYPYNLYKDCSSSLTFKENEGAQLYEAESLTLSSNLKIESNIAASNKEVVSHFLRYETITLEIESSSNCLVMLSLNCSYVSESGRSISSSSLFTVHLNNSNIPCDAIIQANYNSYDFTENDLVSLHLLPGKNTIQISSLGNNLILDYLALRGRIESVSKETIGSQKVFFSDHESRQIYSSHLSEISGPIIIYDEAAIEKNSTYFSNPYDSLTYLIQSQNRAETNVGIRLRLAKENLFPTLEIKLNDILIDSSALTLSTFYLEFDLGRYPLEKGENIFSIKNVTGSFYFDSLILNRDITHSPSKNNERYEAEDALLTEGGEISYLSQASNHYVVTNNQIASYVNFTITSLVEDDVFLSLGYSYIGQTIRSDMVFEVSMYSNQDVDTSQYLNYQVIDTSQYLLYNTSGYNLYRTCFLGKIHLGIGQNVLRFFSNTGNYNLDYIDLFRAEKKNSELVIEAEESILANGNYALYSKTASKQKAVISNTLGSTLTFSIYSSKRENVVLSMQYSLQETLSLASLFTLEFNQNEIELATLDMTLTSHPSLFLQSEITPLTLEEGFNQIKIKNISDSLVLDYFLLA